MFVASVLVLANEMLIVVARWELTLRGREVREKTGRL